MGPSDHRGTGTSQSPIQTQPSKYGGESNRAPSTRFPHSSYAYSKGRLPISCRYERIVFALGRPSRSQKRSCDVFAYNRLAYFLCYSLDFQLLNLSRQCLNALPPSLLLSPCSVEFAILTPRAAGRCASSAPPSPAQQRFRSCQRSRPTGGKGPGDRRRLWQHGHIGMAPRRSDCRLGTCLATRKRKGGRHQGKSPLHLFTSSRLAGRLFGRLWGRAARPRFLRRLRGRTSFRPQRVASSASPIHLIPGGLAEFYLFRVARKLPM